MQPEVSGESGLLVEIPEAEPVVGRHRSTCDVGVADGVPAHVTVLFPFAPASLVDDALLTRLGELFADQPAFDVRFDRTAWFDERVLFLAPVDPEPFIRLTAAAMEAFPEYPPYQGRHDGLTPHLTIGNGCPTEDLRAAFRRCRRGTARRGFGRGTGHPHPSGRRACR